MKGLRLNALSNLNGTIEIYIYISEFTKDTSK